MRKYKYKKYFWKSKSGKIIGKFCSTNGSDCRSMASCINYFSSNDNGTLWSLSGSNRSGISKQQISI